MWRLYDEVQEIGDHPGFKMRPDGRPAEDMDGNPALDTNVQVQAKELQLKIIRELRLLDGRDRVQRLPRVAEEEARAQAAASLAAIGTMVAEQRAEVERRHQRELEEARRSPVVLGEVVEDQERQRRGEGG